jgi:serine/threonine-protein kinase
VTSTGLGTPYYMAPEQIQGGAGVGPAADIWAFGVVAYECLTGRRPFGGDTVGDLLLSILTAKRPRPASSIAPVPPAFDDWLDIACAREPARRFPNIETAANALVAALAPHEGEEITRFDTSPRAESILPPEATSGSLRSAATDRRETASRVAETAWHRLFAQTPLPRVSRRVAATLLAALVAVAVVVKSAARPAPPGPVIVLGASDSRAHVALPEPPAAAPAITPREDEPAPPAQDDRTEPAALPAPPAAPPPEPQPAPPRGRTAASRGVRRLPPLGL